MAGNNSTVGLETVTFTDNMSFDGTERGGAMTTDGQLWIGATASRHVRLGALNSPNGTITIGYVAPNITLDITGGAAAIEKINLQTGTTPIVPAAGIITFNGAVVAAGTNPVRTDGTGASTMALEVQISQAIASTNASRVGLAAFDSARFTVDANGFVSLSTTGVLEQLTGNSGGAISPSNNNINTLGTGSITIAGAGSTLTTQLTGLTNHAVLVGAGTATITNVGPTATSGQVLQSLGAAADPAFSTATYPSTTTINQILYSSSTNTVTGLATANQGVLTTGTTGIPVITSIATNGQLIIGSTVGAPAAATLTAGTGISITNGSNSISIAINGSVVGETITGDNLSALSPTAGNWNIFGLSGSKTSGTGSTLTIKSPPFSQVGASATSALNSGEFVTAAVTRTLPVSAGLADGDLFIYVCTTAGALVIQSVGAQKIRIGSLISAAAGTATSTAIGDSVTLRFNATDGFFYAVSVIGTWLIA